jgi:predicted dehydrogenase
MVGFKKMFFPANEKAKELASREDFGNVSLVMVQYPLYIPKVDEFDAYINGKLPSPGVRGFLDHICHPVSLILYLMGVPESFYYERTLNGAGMVTFMYSSGAIVSLALTQGASNNGGMERTTIISDSGKHIIVNNNIRVSYHQGPPDIGYGDTPSYYKGNPGQTTATWEPEFSLGQLYNKGLFLLGYYNEVAEFARSVMGNRSPSKGTLEQAWQVTRIFELFAEGPGKKIIF